jgi:hypothetical protein
MSVAQRDGNCLSYHSRLLEECSPRVRGWSDGLRYRKNREKVFPARAGLERYGPLVASRGIGVPRACGAGAIGSAWISGSPLCSPRVRGWSVPEVVEAVGGRVFPALAGLERFMAMPSPATCVSPARSICINDEIIEWLEWLERRSKNKKPPEGGFSIQTR